MNNEKKNAVKVIWRNELETAFCQINLIVDLNKCIYVAISTTLFNTITEPIVESHSEADYQYQLIQCNVNDFNIIQLGMTFLDKNGECSTFKHQSYQFNFKCNFR